MNTHIEQNPPTKPAIRGKWANKTEFILSCMGYAIGLGNIWRFPYLCYRNGGGAFLIPYLLMLCLCGIPLFYLEMNLGQFTSLGCMSIFRLAPLFKGASYAMIIINVFCTCYYMILITYPLIFMVYSFGATLPWDSCSNAWNTQQCRTLLEYHSNDSTSDAIAFTTPADEFFHIQVLQISDGIGTLGGVVWSILLGDIFVWFVVFLCIMNGVRTVGKVVYFTATFPFVILAILFVRGVTLPGAIDGITFYITPQWAELTNMKVWADAAIQIFFSLGPGWGGIVNMASYNPFRNNTKFDSLLIPIINCGTSIFAGFVVFSVLGFMSHQTGIPVANVATGGPGLAFITYPEAVAMMPYPNLWSIMFFCMLFLLGIDTGFVQLESIVSAILDEYPKLRGHQRKVTLVAIALMGSGSILCTTRAGMYVIQLLDWYAAPITVILICLVELMTIVWIYGVHNFARDVEFMTDRRPGWIMCCCWRYVTPIILMVMFVMTIVYNTDVTYNGREYPSWAIAVGWGTCLVSLLCIPLYMVYKIASLKGSLSERIITSLTAADMKPANEPYRGRFEDMISAEKKKQTLNMI